MKNLTVFIYTTTLCLFSFAISAQTTHTFIGNSGMNNWNTAANWDTGMIPAAGDNVIINTQIVFFPQTTPPAPGNLRIENSVVFNMNFTAGTGSGTDEAVRITGSGNLAIADGNTFTVNAPTDKNGIFVFGSGAVTVNSGGTLDITQGQNGINFASNATSAQLTNEGTITVTGTTANDGISMGTGSSPTIINNGTMTLSGQGDDAVEMTGGTFTNSGTLNAVSGSGNNNHGILIATDASMTNTGTINLTGDNTARQMFLDGAFTNDKGGIVDVDERIRNNNGTLINNGLIKSTRASGAGIFRVGSGTGTNTNNAFYDYADGTAGFSNNGNTDNGIALNDPAQTTISTGDDGDGDACTVDLAEMSCEWFNNGNSVGTSDATGSLTLPENSVPTDTEVLTLQEYGGAVSITITDICNSASLPVDLVYFTAEKQKNYVVSEWETATETNNDFFTVERSTDGRNFTTLAEISGAGESAEPIIYKTTDKNPHAGVNYYRLVQTDFDGTKTVYRVVSVAMKNTDTINVYPTLVTDILTVEMQETTSGSAYVFDLTGRVLQSKTFTETDAMTLSFADLPGGIYTLRVQAGEQVKTVKVMK